MGWYLWFQNSIISTMSLWTSVVVAIMYANVTVSLLSWTQCELLNKKQTI
jgi:hypothetical protein